MVIAVNTRFLIKDTLEGYGYFIQETMRIMVQRFPGHQFHFFFDRPYDKTFLFGPNVIPHVLYPPARHPLLWRIWYDIQLPLAIKKIKADILLAPDGFCSLTTSVPQCLVLHDISFLKNADWYKKSHQWYFKWNIPRFLKKAASIATVSEFSKKDILQNYKVNAGKIDVVYNGVKDIFKPLSFTEREQVKDQLTGGKEYFICTGAIHPRKNLVNLLKAFSRFKKRQQTNMVLVLAGRMAWKNEAFSALLKTYKYRSDVILTGYVPEQELAKITAAAYAMVLPSFMEGFGVPALEAMRCGVPVLAAAEGAIQEIAGNAALYFNPAEPPSIAGKLMEIYKDEQVHTMLIQKGSVIAGQYSWERTADLLWKSMEKAMLLNRKK